MKKFGFASPCFSNSEKLLCTVIYILACGTEIHHQHFPFPTCQHHANTTGIAVIIFFVWRLCYNCIRHFRMFFLSKSVCDLPFIYFQGLILQLGLQLESGEWQNMSKKKLLQFKLREYNRQYCHANVTMFSGHKVVCYCNITTFYWCYSILKPKRNLNNFRAFQGP